MSVLSLMFILSLMSVLSLLLSVLSFRRNYFCKTFPGSRGDSHGDTIASCTLAQ
ncbi:hypothetical protein K469DRAFT_719461, partial [Zopfia rhizophila CBS 207.26]